MRKERRSRAAERIAEEFDIPPEAFPPVPKITISGRNVLIEGHRGIEEYGEELISVRCRGFKAVIRGRGLRIGAMNSREIMITGAVSAVEM